MELSSQSEYTISTAGEIRDAGQTGEKKKYLNIRARKSKKKRKRGGTVEKNISLHNGGQCGWHSSVRTTREMVHRTRIIYIYICSSSSQARQRSNRSPRTCARYRVSTITLQARANCYSNAIEKLLALIKRERKRENLRVNF